MASKPTVLIIGTLDTKQAEILYLRTQIIASSNEACAVKVLDISKVTKDQSVYPLIPPSELLLPLQSISEELKELDRGQYADLAISHCVPVVKDLVSSNDVHGIISAAGSTGSSIATAIMRKACVIGFPKLMVSTMASGDVKPYIEETDITMMYSVVDIAGLNSVLKSILSNAAGAIVGMTSAYVLQRKASEVAVPPTMAGKRIGVTMFGVTTPCVDTIRKILSSTPHDVSAYELYVFHATGAGGLSMERLIEEGQIDAVIDLTTTEIADHLVGGILSAGPARLEAAARKGIPTIISVGACDMVNFGPRESVPDKFIERNLYAHNPAVTLMRTTMEENKQIGQFIVEKLTQYACTPGKIRVVLPTGGVSMIDQPRQSFYDPEADQALFETITMGLEGSEIEVFERPENINDDTFAEAICDHILELMGVSPRAYRLANARRRKWSFDHGPSLELMRRASLVKVPDAE